MTSDLADVATRNAPLGRKPSQPPAALSPHPPKKKSTLKKVAPIQKSLMAGGR